MELGARLRQARQEAGLSQRQLCGEVITRNMLSQIENGSAKPSMQTFRYLAEQLGKPLSYFLEEEAVISPNQQRIAAAKQAFRQGDYRQAMGILEQWKPDTILEEERWLLMALSAIKQSALAIDEGKNAYAQTLLTQAAEAGAKTCYYTEEIERQRLLLLYRARPELAIELADRLPDNLSEILLRAQAALQQEDWVRGSKILDGAAPCQNPEWNILRAELYFGEGEYEKAAEQFSLAREEFSFLAIQRLEQCYRELGDYKKAYEYACYLREIKE